MLQRVLSPMNVDFFCLGKKFLVYNLVSRNLKIKYRRSYLGVFWTLLAPLATALMYYFVFNVILEVKIPNYLAFVVSGVLPWAFFSQTVIESTESLVINSPLITKIPIPLQIFPYTATLTNFITLLFSIPVILGIALFAGVQLTATSLLFPIYYVSLFLLAYSFSILFAISFVYLRDLKHVLSIIMQLWFYGTPVLYTDVMIPERYQWILYANPVAMLFKGLRLTLLEGSFLTASEFSALLVWSVATPIVAIVFFKNYAHKTVEIL